MSTLPRDLRYAVRQLRKSPAFTVAAVLTLALGVGATTAIFSVVYGLLLASLPFHDADRIGPSASLLHLASMPARRHQRVPAVGIPWSLLESRHGHERWPYIAEGLPWRFLCARRRGTP